MRCPTPYPKEMRGKVRHARNLAMRQMVGGGGVGEEMGGTPLSSSAVDGGINSVDAAVERNSKSVAQRTDYSEVYQMIRTKNCIYFFNLS